MKRKEFFRRSLACLLIAAMMPQQTIAFAAEQASNVKNKKEDVLVRWIPTNSVIEPGEKGAIKLESRINKKNVEHAEVSIHLDPSEVFALCDEKLEDDSRISIDWRDDGSADLYFDLDEDTPRLSKKIYFQMPTDSIFDIDVTADDIDVVVTGTDESGDEEIASPSDAREASPSDISYDVSTTTSDTKPTDENAATSSDAKSTDENAATSSDIKTTDENAAISSDTKTTDENAATSSDAKSSDENAATPSDAKNIEYEDDNVATESEIGDSKHVKISTENGFIIRRETQALRVEGVRPEWKMDVKAKSSSDEDAADTLDFSLTASPKNRKSAKSLADKEQTLTLTITVPEWLTIKSGEVTWDREDEQLLIDGTTVAKLEGIPEEFVLTDASVLNEQTIEVSFERIQGEEELLTIIEGEYEEAVGPALLSANDEVSDENQINAVSLLSDANDIEVISLDNSGENLLSDDSDSDSDSDSDDESDEYDISPVSELSNLKLTLSLYKSAPLLTISDDIDLTYVDEATNGEVSLAAVLMTTSAGLKDTVSADANVQIALADYIETAEETIEVDETTNLKEFIYWIDNGNASKNRPANEDYLEKCKQKIYFTIDDYETKYELNEANWKKYFYPESSEDNHPVPKPSYSGSSLSLSGLPTKTTVTTSDDTEDNTTVTHNYKWTIELSNFGESSDTTNYSSKYSLVHVTTDNIGEYSSASSGYGWYYVERDELKFYIDIEAGNKNVNENNLLNVIENKFVLHTEYENGSSDKRFNDIQGKQTPTYNTATKEYDFNIKGVWKYNLDGTLLTYSLKEKETATGKITNEQLNGAISNIDNDDYLLISYNNVAVPNFGSVITKLHNGGTIDLLLKGDTSYNATKIWADKADSSKRPTGTLELWRYREGESYKDAAPVRDGEGIILSTKIGNGTTDSDNQEEITFGTNSSDLSLEKYDPEGYEYIYVTREYLDSTTSNGNNANSYEQIYGEIKTDSSTGKEYVLDNIEGSSITRDYQTERGDESSTYDDNTAKPSAYVSGNDWLYNGGTLTNHLKDQVTANGVKHWESKAFQDDLKDVTVTMTLYSRKANDTDSNWTPVDSVKPIELKGFQNETVENDTFSASVPQYDSEGNKLVYRWIETNVAQNKDGSEINTNFTLQTESTTNFIAKLLGTVKNISDDPQKASFSLSHIGESSLVQYESTSEYNQESGVSTIFNNIVDTATFTLNKKWADGIEPYDVNFSLFRTIGDGKSENLGTIELAGDYPDAENTWNPASENTGIVLNESENWNVVLAQLPKYDSDGHQYQYYVTEASDASHENVTPTYTTNRDDNGNWETTVTNSIGSGTNIWVRKDWLDDGDSSHREPVTIGIYKKSTSTDSGADTKIIQVILSAENAWYTQVNVGDNNIDDLYIVEEKVGTTDILTSNNITEVTEDSVKNLSYTTDHHIYKVSYQKSSGNDDSNIFVVQNRRVGTIDFTVTKEWKDGDGSSRVELKRAVDAYNNEHQDNKIDLKIRLKFSSVYNSSENQPYNITYNTTECDTVTVNQDGASQIYKSKNDGNYSDEGYSSYSLLDGIQTGEDSEADDTSSSNTTEFHFFNLPKYDYTGANVAYTVEEVWVNASGETISDLSRYSATVDSTTVNISDLWSKYSMSLNDAYYEVGQQYTGDQQKVTMTNRLSGTKDILWHKQWQDDYNYQAGQRPDIYLTIYRGRSKDNTVSEYSTQYRWLTPENSVADDDEMSKLHHWHAVVSGVPKYDDEGYELTYFALENTKVNKGSLDYETAKYSLVTWGDETTETTENSTKTENVIGTEESITDENYSGYMCNVGNSTSPRFALAEGGTITNQIKNEVTIRGQKLWKNLPADFWENENASDSLPNIKISVLRQLSDQSDNKTEVATLTIKNTDWKYLGSKGSYSFTLSNEGDYEYDTTSGSAVLKPVSSAGSSGTDTESTEKPQLKRYNERGKLYEYTLTEQMNWSYNNSSEDTAQNPGFVYQNTVNAYVLTNTYNSQKGAVRVKKLLELPNTTTNFPAIAMKLTRIYQILDTSGNWSQKVDSSFAMTKVWSAESVKAAFNAAEQAGPTNASYTLDSTTETGSGWTDPFLFENLDVYAPNGSKYTYYVQEVKDNYLYGFDTWAVNISANSVTKNDNNKNQATQQIKVDLIQNQNGGRGDTAQSVDIKATYLNAITKSTEKITIEGQKLWTHYSFQKLPSTDEFASWLTLYRSADAQNGEQNGISQSKVTNVKFYVTIDDDTGSSEDSNTGLQTTTYKYKIIADDAETTGGEPGALQLEKYAPNGMPWKYVVEEKIPNGLTDYFSTGNNQNTASVSKYGTNANTDGKVTMNQLTNTALTETSYSKKWVDDDGKAIKADYTGLGTLKVNFELQVKEGNTGSWFSAENYFTRDKTLTNNASYNNLSIEGNLLSNIWKTGKSIDNLPKFVSSSTPASESSIMTYIPLFYRVVEKSVSIKDSATDNWKEIVSWTVNDNEDKNGYTLVAATNTSGSDTSGSSSTGQANSMITPYYGKDTSGTTLTYHSNDNNNHTNQLHLQSLTITKKWENDRNNLWGTRPKAEASGNDWSAWFVVQRREKDNTSDNTAAWEIVKQYNIDGTEKGSYIVTISGENTANSGTATVTGLLQTAPSGKAYEYRLVELPDSNADLTNLQSTDAPDGYSVSYDDGSSASLNTYQATNTLQTTVVEAAKSWINNDPESSIQLKLQYLGIDNQYYDVKNSTVTLDGTSESNPASASDASSNNAFGYEDNAWHAKWTLPKILPSAMRESTTVEAKTDSDETTYRVVELNNDGTSNNGYRQINESGKDQTTGETTIKNMKLVKLNLSKIWRANNDAKKEVKIDIYRIAGATGVPENDTNSTKLGTVTLNSGNNWTWSGYYLDSTSSDNTRTYFDKYTTVGDPQQYLYYAREVSVGERSNWSDNKLTTGDNKRYQVESQTLAFTDMASGAASPSSLSGDERSAAFTNFQLRDIEVKKIWNDNGNAYSTRPDSLVVKLYRTTGNVTTDESGNITSRNTWTQVGSDVTLTSDNKMAVSSHIWSYTWHDLPYYDENGSLYTYKVEEIVPTVRDGATPEYSHTSGAVYVCNGVAENGSNTVAQKIDDTGVTELVNTLTKKISVSGTKYWADGGNNRPENITLALKRTTEPVQETSNWQENAYTESNNSIFSVIGSAVTSVANLFTGSSTDTSEPKLSWNKSGNQWTYTFSNLDNYDQTGKRYIYKVEETVPAGYRNEVLTTDSDNSGLPDLVNVRQTELSIEKKWYKTNDVNPQSVLVKIYRTTADEIPESAASDSTGDSEYIGEVYLNKNTGWKWTGSYLEPDEEPDDNKIYFDSYKVYDSDGKPLTNPQKYLYYAREDRVSNDSAITDASDGYITVDSKLFKITENASSALTATPGQLDSSTAVIVNRQTTDLELTKTWLDSANSYNTRPDQLTIKLSRKIEGGDEEELSEATAQVVKGNDNKWTFTWRNMPMYDMDGNLYTYYAKENVPDVKEDSLLTGSSYICLASNNTVSFDSDGKALLTNLLKKETDLAGQKTWSDGDGSIRPDKIDLTLYRRLSGKSDWEEVEDAEPTWYKQADGTWNFIYANILQTDESGVHYYYKVEESVPDGYRVYYSKDDDGNELILKNVANGSLTVSKQVTGRGGNKQKEFHFTIEVGKLPDGSKLPDGTYGNMVFTDSKAEITLKNGESMTATGLPGEITYVVKETEANTGGYKTSSENDEGVVAPNALQSVLFINNRAGSSSSGGSGGSSGNGEKNPNGNIPTGPALKPTEPAEPTTPIEPEPDNTKDHESPTIEDDPGSVAGRDRDKLINGESDEEGSVRGKNRVAKTGDSADIAKNLIEIFAAGAGILFILFFRRKKKKEEE